MSKIHIWANMSDAEKNRAKLMDSLYHHCQNRTSTSREVFDSVIADLRLCGTAHIVDAALEIIRPYKNTGINLESTVNSLYDLFYPKVEKPKETKEYNMDWDPNMP